MENEFPGASDWTYTYYGDSEDYDANTRQGINFRLLSQVVTLGIGDWPEVVGMKHFGIAYVSIDHHYVSDDSSSDATVPLPFDFDYLESLS